MQLNIPEGAQVQIIIGEPRPMLALADETRPALINLLRRRRPLLTAAVAVMVLFGAYQLGHHTSSGAIPVAQAEMEAGTPASALARIRPDSPRPFAPMAADPTQVPPAFAQQLRQAPTVVPPPGQASAGGETDAFGLHQ